MLSTSEIAFEPATPKVAVLTTAIFAMTAGDAAIQAEVLAGVRREIDHYLGGDEVDWLTVEAVASAYVEQWRRVNLKWSEAAILAPLGLTHASFLASQASMAPHVVDRITDALMNRHLPSVACIIAGVDRTGPHIWVIENGILRCEDTVGFAAIGAGERHASSQMMSGLHSPDKTIMESVVLVHLAKRRAEVAPSVGAATDLFIIGPTLGSNSFLVKTYMEQLDRDFAKLKKAEDRALKKAHKEFGQHLIATMNAAPSPQQDSVTEG